MIGLCEKEPLGLADSGPDKTITKEAGFLTSPQCRYGLISRLDIMKQNLCSYRRARLAGGPDCTLASRKSTFDCGLGWNR